MLDGSRLITWDEARKNYLHWAVELRHAGLRDHGFAAFYGIKGN